MQMRMTRRTLAALMVAGGALDTARADDVCAHFKWDLAHEHALFGGAATPIEAARDPAGAAAVELDRLYAAVLSPQEQVKYALPPEKKMLADGAYGGNLRFQVASAGHYRIAIGAPFWIDVIAGGKPVPSVDFGGSPGCDTPRKVVEYDLPAAVPLTLQFSGQTAANLRFTITAVHPKQ